MTLTSATLGVKGEKSWKGKRVKRKRMPGMYRSLLSNVSEQRNGDLDETLALINFIAGAPKAPRPKCIPDGVSSLSVDEMLVDEDESSAFVAWASIMLKTAFTDWFAAFSDEEKHRLSSIFTACVPLPCSLTVLTTFLCNAAHLKLHSTAFVKLLLEAIYSRKSILKSIRQAAKAPRWRANVTNAFVAATERVPNFLEMDLPAHLAPRRFTETVALCFAECRMC